MAFIRTLISEPKNRDAFIQGFTDLRVVRCRRCRKTAVGIFDNKADEKRFIDVFCSRCGAVGILGEGVFNPLRERFRQQYGEKWYLQLKPRTDFRREESQLLGPCDCGGEWHDPDLGYSFSGIKRCPFCLADGLQSEEVAPADYFKDHRIVHLSLNYAQIAVGDQPESELGQRLVSALQGQDSLRRDYAAMALFQYRGSLPLDECVRLVQEPIDLFVRLCCIDIIAKRGGASTVPVLIELLSDPNVSIRESIKFELLKMTSQLTPYEFPATIGLMRSKTLALSTLEEWREWWREHRDSVKLRDYPASLKEKMGLL